MAKAGIVAPVGLKDAATEELLAMLEVMYLVATADGFFSTDERKEFLLSMESLSGGKVDSLQLGRLVESWVARGPETDLPGRLKAIAQALPDEISRRIAYGLAVQIAEADGITLETESSMLRLISTAFALEEGAPEEIAQSVKMSRHPQPPK